MTLVDIVDMDDCVIGKDNTTNKDTKGFISRNVIVFVQNNEGLYIICKRANHKKVDPNLYDASVCGDVEVGESYEVAAHRELEEELGIKTKLEMLKKFYNEFPSNGITRRHHTAIFYGRCDDTITLNSELKEYIKISLEELKTRIETSPEQFSYAFTQEFLQVEELLR